MDKFIKELMTGKKVLLLGFGREGQSTYRLVRRILPAQELTIADASEHIAGLEGLKGDTHLSFRLGTAYLEDIRSFDLVIKSPGISLKDMDPPLDPGKITSQTDLFLRKYSSQVIGVTGTKGKSTTSSLICHILDQAGKDVILLGNIGTPAFHYTDRILPGTMVVFELSSHQLQYVERSPHIGIILNLYQEHLDAYRSFEEYQSAKMNIARFSGENDFLIYNAEDPLVLEQVGKLCQTMQRIPFSLKKDKSGLDFHNRYLKGDHNLRNALAAAAACRLCGLSGDEIADGMDSFKGLAHRMEFAGRFHGIDFYNDSIATIPEACMAAVRSIPNVDTLILGGFDRGVDYTELADFLIASRVSTFIVTGAAGMRIADAIEKKGAGQKRVIRIHRFDEFLPYALKYTQPGHVCLLSPAAASYDEFRSFEERGMRFTGLVSRNYTMNQ